MHTYRLVDAYGAVYKQGIVFRHLSICLRHAEAAQERITRAAEAGHTSRLRLSIQIFSVGA